MGSEPAFSWIGSMVARELRQYLSGHPRWRDMLKKLAKQDEEGLLVELNSAVGTLEDEGKEQQLAALIRRIESMPGCIRDYQKWLSEQGVETAGMRPMGHAESVMSRFAHRVKSRRSWNPSSTVTRQTKCLSPLDAKGKRDIWAHFGRVSRREDGCLGSSEEAPALEPQRAALVWPSVRFVDQGRRFL
ncbi:hypothetical protein I656_02563 [Geobacillus sp. WSUCF1]|nr:hypothetical protein I656_02563 [Geobacillus sp. WSUCF1]